MSKPRAIVCPTCKGTGDNVRFLGFPIPCAECNGAGHMTADQLRKRAVFLECIADGGYICGDHNYEDMLRFRSRATTFRDLADGLDARATA